MRIDNASVGVESYDVSLISSNVFPSVDIMSLWITSSY